MFTGVIEHTGRITQRDTTAFGARLVVDAGNLAPRVKRGDSVAVHGVCLTVVADPGPAGELAFDVISQTLRMSVLGDLAVDARVHLEPSATPQTMLGGHIVQGHVDAVGAVVDVRDAKADRRLCIRPVMGHGHGHGHGHGDGDRDRDKVNSVMDCLVEQGSIAINGVSLTVAEVGDDWFEVALIPTTIELTTLGDLRRGEHVNLETDYIAKIVANWLRRHQ